MLNILVLLPLEDYHRKWLDESSQGAELIYSDHRAPDEELVRKADIILGNPPLHMVRGSENLKWLQLLSAGAGEYTREGALPEGVLLTNASGAYGPGIAEYMLGVLLELFRNLHLYRDHQAEAQWRYAGKVKSVCGSVALVVGLGDIGGEFAKRLKSLGAYTIGIRRKYSDKPEYLDELHLMEQLEDVLPRADVVALSLPETKLTNRIINRETLQLMKKDAVLINVGRGSAVDTDALCDALESGCLFGAALDVTDPEPLPKEHRLWKTRNAVITPHVSGGFSLQATHDRIIRICADNLKAYLAGKQPTRVVNRSEGY